MILEIVNPSDAVTIVADDIAAAGMGIMLISGWYGLTDEDGEQVLPITALGGQEYWLKEHGITNIEDYIKSHAEAIATILESFLYGRAADRKLFDSAISRMSPENAETFRAEWNDQRRSSMTNIGKACISTAKALRATLQKELA